MAKSRPASKTLSIEDKISIGLIVVFVIVVSVLMRLDTASWAFRHDDYFIAVNDHLPPPVLDFTVTDIGNGNLQLHLDLENITLAEFCSPKDVGLAKGHAHIFVDGKKQGSFYITEAVIENIPSGNHTVTVSLNKPPTHKVLTWLGEPIAKTITVKVK